MKKQVSTFWYVIRLSVTLLIITAVMAALLAWVNSFTAPRIAALSAEKKAAAISAVLPNGESAQLVENFPDETGLVSQVYANESGYALEVNPAGFGGTINMMVGVSSDGQVLGIRIVNHTETAGLGEIAAADSGKGEAFRNQFIGMSGELAITKDGGTVDAITGATVTSRAVNAGVNAALACVAGMD